MPSIDNPVSEKFLGSFDIVACQNSFYGFCNATNLPAIDTAFTEVLLKEVTSFKQL